LDIDPEPREYDDDYLEYAPKRVNPYAQ
jgi:hypothetical protein